MDQQSTNLQSTLQPKSKKGWYVGGAIVIVIIAGILMYNRSQTVNPTSNGGVNAIVVGDQDPDAVAVLVDYVSLSQPGFVVIHPNQKNNEPSSVVLAASSLLAAGEHRNISVIMHMTAGESYHATIHIDNGNGSFEAENDLPAADTNGAAISTRFKVRLSSTPEDVKG